MKPLLIEIKAGARVTLTPLLQTTDPSIEADIEAETEESSERLWRVIIHNDEVTPMEFVVYVLVRIFNRPLIIAEAIMWEAHVKGQAIVGAWSKEEAERLVSKAHFAAQMEGYPLQFTLEEG